MKGNSLLPINELTLLAWLLPSKSAPTAGTENRSRATWCCELPTPDAAPLGSRSAPDSKPSLVLFKPQEGSLLVPVKPTSLVTVLIP